MCAPKNFVQKTKSCLVTQKPFVAHLNFYARNHYAAVHGLQGKKLLNDQEQEEEHRTSRDEEILSAVPAPYGPS